MITVQCKLLPSMEQEQALLQTVHEYIASINDLVEYISAQADIPKLSSASFYATLPSAVKNEVINAAQSIWKKFRAGRCNTLPILKKLVAMWNNQNYRIKDSAIELPVWLDGKSKRISIKAVITDYQQDRLTGKLGALRITKKNGKWIAQIAVDTPVLVAQGDGTMGIDLGLKVPAVAVTEHGKTRFFGKGRQNKYVRRRFKVVRQAMGKAKKPHAIQRLTDKEQRWMRDQDHKISRGIIDFARSQGVEVLRLEQLQGIRQTARTSRKNEKNLHTWSFYRLARFIEYKATMAGIRVEYVDPAYTSQRCPCCGRINHAKDRKYRCVCGFRSHRDRVGALNILKAPVIVGQRQSA